MRTRRIVRSSRTPRRLLRPRPGLRFLAVSDWPSPGFYSWPGLHSAAREIYGLLDRQRASLRRRTAPKSDPADDFPSPR